MIARPKVIILSAGLRVGGVERSLLGLLHSLDPATLDVTVFLHGHDGEFMPMLPKWVRLLPPIAEYEALDRPLRQVLFSSAWRVGLARLAAKVTSVVRKCLGRRGFLLARSVRYSLPFLPWIPGDYELAVSFLTPHDPVLHRVSARYKVGWIHTDYTAAETSVDVSFEASAWMSLDRLVAVSPDTATTFTRVFPAACKKITVIENILSPGFVRAQARASNVDAEMSIEPGVFRICSVGRLTHQKGFDLAIKACAQLRSVGIHFRWYIIGGGMDEWALRRQIEREQLQDEVILLGQKTNPYPYMAACDLYVQPSRYEGKAVTVREAQMLGLPVMITRYPTADSQLEEGVDGYVAELGPDGIAAGVTTLLRDNALRLRLAAVARSRDYGNLSEVAKFLALIPSPTHV